MTESLEKLILKDHSPIGDCWSSREAFNAGVISLIIPTIFIFPWFTNKATYQNPSSSLVVISALIIFAVIGFFLIGKGFYKIYIAENRNKRKSKFPYEPWQFDYNWNQDGIEFNDYKNLYKIVLYFGFAAVFSLPLYFLFINNFATNNIKIWFILIAASGVIIWALGSAIIGFSYFLIRQFKYDTSYLKFKKFPYFLGEEIEVYFSNKKIIKKGNKLIATLRFIEESIESVKRGRQHIQDIIVYQTYNDRKNIEILEEKPQMVKINFLIPENCKSNNMSKNFNKSYWELEISSTAKGIDFNARFLIPIYSISKKRKPAERAGRAVPSV